MSKIPYPKHVWSPAGGWYSQPANWKGNTAIMMGVVLAITGSVWAVSANLEHRDRFPAPGRFYPSRYWSREVRENDRKQKEQS